MKQSEKHVVEGVITRLRLGPCSHPSAVLVNPNEKELGELEVMLSTCPNCSSWLPGDGPIMAVITTQPLES